jgi:hypothetical protein
MSPAPHRDEDTAVRVVEDTPCFHHGQADRTRRHPSSVPHVSVELLVRDDPLRVSSEEQDQVQDAPGSRAGAAVHTHLEPLVVEHPGPAS